MVMCVLNSVSLYIIYPHNIYHAEQQQQQQQQQQKKMMKKAK